MIFFFYIYITKVEDALLYYYLALSSKGRNALLTALSVFNSLTYNIPQEYLERSYAFNVRPTRLEGCTFFNCIMGSTVMGL